MPIFRAIETDLRTGRPTGAVHLLETPTRAEALAALLQELGIDGARATVSESGKMVAFGSSAWLLVAPPKTDGAASASLRRGGPTHRRTR